MLVVSIWTKLNENKTCPCPLGSISIYCVFKCSHSLNSPTQDGKWRRRHALLGLCAKGTCEDACVCVCVFRTLIFINWEAINPGDRDYVRIRAGSEKERGSEWFMFILVTEIKQNEWRKGTDFMEESKFKGRLKWKAKPAYGSVF